MPCPAATLEPYGSLCGNYGASRTDIRDNSRQGPIMSCPAASSGPEPPHPRGVQHRPGGAVHRPGVGQSVAGAGDERTGGTRRGPASSPSAGPTGRPWPPAASPQTSPATRRACGSGSWRSWPTGSSPRTSSPTRRAADDPPTPRADLADTTGNLHLRLLVGLLRVVANVTEGCLDEHPQDCGCEFCERRDPNTWLDVMGLSRCVGAVRRAGLRGPGPGRVPPARCGPRPGGAGRAVGPARRAVQRHARPLMVAAVFGVFRSPPR